MFRFYLTSIVINTVLIFSSFVLLEFLIESFLMYNAHSKLLGKLTVISDLSLTYFFYRFFFLLLSPLTIRVFKKYQYHWVVFLALNISISILYFLYNKNHIGWERLTYEVSFFVTIGFLVSILIHFSQMLIGRKLLPKFYRKH
jgi:hypothetical protein